MHHFIVEFQLLECVAITGVDRWGTGGTRPPHFSAWWGPHRKCPPHFFA